MVFTQLWLCQDSQTCWFSYRASSSSGLTNMNLTKKLMSEGRILKVSMWALASVGTGETICSPDALPPWGHSPPPHVPPYSSLNLGFHQTCVIRTKKNKKKCAEKAWKRRAFFSWSQLVSQVFICCLPSGLISESGKSKHKTVGHWKLTIKPDQGLPKLGAGPLRICKTIYFKFKIFW